MPRASLQEKPKMRQFGPRAIPGMTDAWTFSYLSDSRVVEKVDISRSSLSEKSKAEVSVFMDLTLRLIYHARDDIAGKGLLFSIK